MVPTRVMPCLLLKGSGLVKTVKFKDPKYLGDPRNTVKIFNDKEVDELIILDILATPEKKEPQYDLIREIVSEAFMPVAYGGGINSIDQVKKLIALGIEKVVLNTAAIENPDFVAETADQVGGQSTVVCMDVRRSLFGKYELYTHGGRKAAKKDPVEFAKLMQEKGAGELVINSIDRDGTMSGYDIPLIQSVSDAVSIPVVACGGAGNVQHLGEAIKHGGASAVAAGSMFVFQGKHRAVLISFPEPSVLREVLDEAEIPVAAKV